MLGSKNDWVRKGVGEHRAWPEHVNMRSVPSMKQRMRDELSEDRNLYTDTVHVLQVF